MKKALKISIDIPKYLKFMENIKSASPLTLKHYRIDLLQAFNYENQYQHGKELSEEALLAKIREAFNGWAKLSLASRNRKAATLKSFLSWAFDEKLTERDLSFQVTCPKVPRKLPHFLSVDEVLSVLKVLNQDDKTPSRELVLFLLLYGGGLRVSEACNLKWSDVNFPKGQLCVLGKGHKERLITTPALTRQVLKTWSQGRPKTEYIFGEAPLNTRTAYEMIRQAGRKADLLKPLHPHALRHSFATHLLTSGANLRTLQELLGHESLQATEKYLHLGIDQLARTLESMHPLGSKK